LEKKSPVKHKGFQSRFFVLTPLSFRYFKAQKKGPPMEKKGELPIHSIRVVRQMVSTNSSSASALLDDRIAIDFGSEHRQFLLKAPSVQDATAWVQMLQLAMQGYKLLQGASQEIEAVVGHKKKWWKASLKNNGADKMTIAQQWDYWDGMKDKLQILPPKSATEPIADTTADVVADRLANDPDSDEYEEDDEAEDDEEKEDDEEAEDDEELEHNREAKAEDQQATPNHRCEPLFPPMPPPSPKVQSDSCSDIEPKVHDAKDTSDTDAHAGRPCQPTPPIEGISDDLGQEQDAAKAAPACAQAEVQVLQRQTEHMQAELLQTRVASVAESVRGDKGYGRRGSHWDRGVELQMRALAAVAVTQEEATDLENRRLGLGKRGWLVLQTVRSNRAQKRWMVLEEGILKHYPSEKNEMREKARMRKAAEKEAKREQRQKAAEAKRVANAKGKKQAVSRRPSFTRKTVYRKKDKLNELELSPTTRLSVFHSHRLSDIPVFSVEDNAKTWKLQAADVDEMQKWLDVLKCSLDMIRQGYEDERGGATGTQICSQVNPMVMQTAQISTKANVQEQQEEVQTQTDQQQDEKEEEETHEEKHEEQQLKSKNRFKLPAAPQNPEQQDAKAFGHSTATADESLDEVQLPHHSNQHRSQTDETKTDMGQTLLVTTTSGYLVKRAISSQRNWKRRYFELDHTTAKLRYWKKEDEAKPNHGTGGGSDSTGGGGATDSSNSKGCLVLTALSRVHAVNPTSSAERETLRKHLMELSLGGETRVTLSIAAASAEDRARWLTAFRAVIDQLIQRDRAPAVARAVAVRDESHKVEMERARVAALAQQVDANEQLISAITRNDAALAAAAAELAAERGAKERQKLEHMRALQQVRRDHQRELAEAVKAKEAALHEEYATASAAAVAAAAADSASAMADRASQYIGFFDRTGLNFHKDLNSSFHSAAANRSARNAHGTQARIGRMGPDTTKLYRVRDFDGVATKATPQTSRINSVNHNSNISALERTTVTATSSYFVPSHVDYRVTGGMVRVIPVPVPVRVGASSSSSSSCGGAGGPAPAHAHGRPRVQHGRPQRYKWRAHVMCQGVERSLGLYDTKGEGEAACRDWNDAHSHPALSVASNRRDVTGLYGGSAIGTAIGKTADKTVLTASSQRRYDYSFRPTEFNVEQAPERERGRELGVGWSGVGDGYSATGPYKALATGPYKALASSSGSSGTQFVHSCTRLGPPVINDRFKGRIDALTRTTPRLWTDPSTNLSAMTSVHSSNLPSRPLLAGPAWARAQRRVQAASLAIACAPPLRARAMYTVPSPDQPPPPPPPPPTMSASTTKLGNITYCGHHYDPPMQTLP
jgi:hypothetical protein